MAQTRRADEFAPRAYGGCVPVALPVHQLGPRWPHSGIGRSPSRRRGQSECHDCRRRGDQTLQHAAYFHGMIRELVLVAADLSASPWFASRTPPVPPLPEGITVGRATSKADAELFVKGPISPEVA